MMDSWGSHEKPVILIGYGGHGRVLLSLFKLLGIKLVGICDPGFSDDIDDGSNLFPLFRDDKVISQYSPSELNLVLGIGQRVGCRLREQVFYKFKKMGFFFPSVIHPAAYVDGSVSLSEGVQVMAGAIVQTGARIGENTIINTRASVDHDCVIASNVHIAPGAVLCGNVSVGEGSFVGAGAVIIQGIEVKDYAVVGAGVSLVRNLETSCQIIPGAQRVRLA